MASVTAQEEELGFESDHSIEHACPIEDEELESDNNHSNYGESDYDSEGEGPYSGEPIATEEWLKEWKEDVRREEEREEERKRRLNGIVPVNLWCKCGHCQTNLLRKEKETTCCKEIEGCTRSLQDQLVLAEVETPPECITLHPGFAAVCLNKWSLRSAAPKYRTIEGIKYRQSGSEDKFLRAASYRECTQLIHGYLGGGRRIPLPACAVHAIRSTFDIEDGGDDYTGYEDDES